MEELRKMMVGKTLGGNSSGQRSYSYSDVTKGKGENIIIVKSKIQQESEDTRKILKEKVDVKSMEMGITRLKKGNNGTVIMGYQSGEEAAKLKDIVQDRMGEDFVVTESKGGRRKVKVVNVGEDEMQMDDKELISTIRKQNKIDAGREESLLRIEKRILKGGRNPEIKEGTLIIATDERIHETMVGRGRINIGWRKCRVFNHINLKRCFKCWGYRHIAKNCKREVVCHKCAGKHKGESCNETKVKCVNCLYKNQTFNLKINDEHDALDLECPSYKRAMQEERRRVGWEGKQ